jgi:hypothetical protein
MADLEELEQGAFCGAAGWFRERNSRFRGWDVLEKDLGDGEIKLDAGPNHPQIFAIVLGDETRSNRRGRSRL